jgi:GAF domain-containing protein
MGDTAVVQDPDRLAAVRGLLLLDAPPHAGFDRLTELAADVLEAPLALMTLIDADRQFFLSASGLPDPLRTARQTPLDYSLCQHAVAAGRPLVAPDARDDPALRHVKAVTEYGIVAYAGVPLFFDRFAVGTLCVLDTAVRHWRPDEVATLQRLADIASDEIRLHVLEKRAARRKEWTGADPRWPRTAW